MWTSQSPHLKKDIVEAENRKRAAKMIKGKKLFYKRLKNIFSLERRWLGQTKYMKRLNKVNTEMQY